MIQPHSTVQLECQNAYHHCGYVMENLNAQMAATKDKKCVVSCVKPISWNSHKTFQYSTILPQQVVEETSSMKQVF